MSKSVLYKIVFDAAYTKWLIAFMFAFFLLHPAVPVFAAEDAMAEVESTTELPEPEPSEEVQQEELEELEEVGEEPVPVEELSPEKNETEIITVESPVEQLNEETATSRGTTTEVATPSIVEQSTGSASSSDSLSPKATSTSDVPTESDSANATSTENDLGEADTETFDDTTPTSTATTTTEVGENIDDVLVQPEVEETTVDAEPEPELNRASTTATTTVVTEYVYIDRLNTDPNIIAFDVKECSSVGDGSFYCSKTQQVGDATVNDSVFTARDSDGDAEIFLRYGGETIQLSKNMYDDGGPDFDAKTNTVVWHRLVDGHYQIVLYDYEKGDESLLTRNQVNDMEPSHEDGVTVWQRWVDGNWEIIFFDGQNEIQLTENDVHDVSPDIRNGYVMWNTTGSGGQKEVAVYEIVTGLISNIADEDGGQVANPRFVLVYDTKYANGDIITKGFNPETGEVEPLSATPADLPQEIPESDQTGETRALIQNKTTNGREDAVDGGSDEPIVDTDNNTVDTATSSDVSLDDSPISASSTDDLVEDIDLRATSSDSLQLSDFDLIVEPYSSATSSQVEDTATTSNPVE